LPRCAARARRRCPSGHACAGNHMPAGSVWQIGPRRARVQGPGRRAGHRPGASSAARAVRYRCSLYLLTVIHSLGSAGMPRTCAAACMCLPTHTVRMLVHAISTSIACRHASECPCSCGCHTWPPAHGVKTLASPSLIDTADSRLPALASGRVVVFHLAAFPLLLLLISPRPHRVLETVPSLPLIDGSTHQWSFHACTFTKLFTFSRPRRHEASHQRNPARNDVTPHVNATVLETM